MKRACENVNTNTDEQKASSIRPLKNNFVRMKTVSKRVKAIVFFSLLIAGGFVFASNVNVASVDNLSCEKPTKAAYSELVAMNVVSNQDEEKKCDKKEAKKCDKKKEKKCCDKK